MGYVHKASLPFTGAPITVSGTPIAAGLDAEGRWSCWYVTDGRLADVCTSPTGGIVPPPHFRHLDSFTDTAAGLVVHVWTTGPRP